MNNLLGPKAGYIEILDHYTTERLEEVAAKPSKYMPLRPSAAGKCSRELAYELMEFRGMASYEKSLRDPASDRLLSLGHDIEYHTLRKFKDAFYRADKDLSIKYKQQVLSFFDLPSGHKVEGSIDAVFMSPKWGAVIDIKSKKDKFSRFKKTHWDETDENLTENKFVEKFGDSCYYIEDLKSFLDNLKDPFWSNNFYQLNLYFFDEHKFLRSRGIDHAALIYYCKNDSRLREIRFKPSQEVYESIKNKFQSVSEAVDLKQDPELVPKDYMLGSIKCAFCSFSKNCWGDKDTLKEYFKTWPKKKWPKDTDRMDGYLGQDLEKLYDQWKMTQQDFLNGKESEDQLAKVMHDNKLWKVRFEDGKIYELKTLKSGGAKGGPRMVLRRGKL